MSARRLHWASSIVGSPWLKNGRSRAGIDCYGVAALAYAEQLGIELATFDGRLGAADAGKEAAAIEAIIAGEAVAGDWVSVDFATRREFDILLFFRAGLRTHVAVHLRGDEMLHIEGEGDWVRVERLTRSKWEPRHAGTFRHRLMTGRDAS